MKQYDPSDIVERLKKGGKIGREEIEFIRNRLRNLSPDDDLYSLVRAMGLGVITPSPEDIALVGKFFVVETDDWDLQGVIYALCDYWGLTEKYLDQLFSFSILENWGNYPSAAIAAISALGSYAYEKKDSRVFEKLLDLYDKDMELFNTGSSFFRNQHLQLIYKALDIGVRGKEALVDHIKDVRIPEDISEKVINASRRFVKKKHRGIY
jgi:hypothetical protein